MPGVTSTASSAEVPKLGFEPSSIGCTKTASLHPQVPDIISIHYDGSSSNLTVVTRYFVRTNLSQNFIFSPSYTINNGGVSADAMYSFGLQKRKANNDIRQFCYQFKGCCLPKCNDGMDLYK